MMQSWHCPLQLCTHRSTDLVSGGKRLAWLFTLALLLLSLTPTFVWAQTNQLPTVDVQLVSEGFTAPTVLAEAPDGTGRIFIADQVGVIYIVMPDGTLRDEPFLDLRDQIVALSGNFDERGLIGFAFHPDFADNGAVYVHYSARRRDTAPAAYDHTGRVVEFRVSPTDPHRADPASEVTVIEIDQPYSNHNGGAIAFHPDGHLYIGLGDGGGGNDTGPHNPPQGFGQDTTTLLGKILRLRVTPGQPGYDIPADNPFVGSDIGRDEIWAWGLRNPFRMAFDMSGGVPHLFVGDVGQNRWEEINIATHPGNYGWREKEGVQTFDPRNPATVTAEGPATDSAGRPYVDPVIVYPNSNAFGPENGGGTSVTGAYIYQGEALPELSGQLIFTDWTLLGGRPAGQVYVATPPSGWSEAWQEAPVVDGELWPWQGLLAVEGFVRTLARDAAGELYLLTNARQGPTGDTGAVYKLIPAQ